MEKNTKTWVIDSLEDFLAAEKIEDSLLVKELEKQTNGALYSCDFNTYWVLNVKRKGIIDIDYLEKLFEDNNKDINSYSIEINEYWSSYVYDSLYSHYNKDIMNPYTFEVLGRSCGYCGVNIEDIKYYIDLDDSTIEKAINSVSVDVDDYDYYDEIARWILENCDSEIKIDVSDFVDRFNSLENEILKDSEYMESEDFAEDIYKYVAE